MSLCAILLLSPCAVIDCAAVEPPVTPNASPQSKALLAWLGEQQGKHILSGQAEPAPGGGKITTSSEEEFARILKVTGKVPAIRAFDFVAIGPHQDTSKPLPQTERAISWGRSNGIVAIQWHWLASNRSGGWDFAVKRDDEQWRGFDLDRALLAGTPEHDELLASIDAASAELTRLRDAGIPVLWRPLHDASGGWFWWGAKGPESFKKLWKLMFDRMTLQHRLNNLIWVFNPAEPDALEDWYPGDEYVDVISLNRYADTGEYPSFKSDFDALAQFNSGRKVLALSEVGCIPDPEALKKDQAGWAYFCAWCGNFVLDGKVNPTNHLIGVYHSPYVLNRDALPKMSTLPVPKTGTPVKIAFDRQPRTSGVGQLLKPITVVAKDQTGNVVRGATGTVRLTLQGQSRYESMDATFVNGVATFRPKDLTNAASNLRFVARADGFGEAVSSTFDVTR